MKEKQYVKKVLICVSEKQYEVLKNISLMRGMSVAALVREKINELLPEDKPLTTRGTEKTLDILRRGIGFFGNQ